jgi:hypothetical protein
MLMIGSTNGRARAISAKKRKSILRSRPLALEGLDLIIGVCGSVT